MQNTLSDSRTFTREQYHQLVKTGELREDNRVELVEGEILTMSPIGPLHLAVVNRLTRLFVLLGNQRFICSVQNPVALGVRSEPLPDIALLRIQADDYRSRTPAADDLLLLIEVMVTSHEHDLHTKLPLYARSGVAEVWLIDVPGRVLHLCRNPQASGQYAEVTRITTNDPVHPLFDDSLTLSLTDLLGDEHA